MQPENSLPVSSLFEGQPKSDEDMEFVFKAGTEAYKQIFQKTFLKELCEKSHIMQQLHEGLSLKDVLQLSDEQMEVLYAQAHRLLSSGNAKQAADAFLALIQVDYMEERFYFGFGVANQMLGDFKLAARAYAAFLSFDAQNPDGYLRLGECHLAVDELEHAREAIAFSITAAKEFHKEGYDDVIEYATKLLEAIDARLAARS
ncbi:MAG: hypothetical protein AAFS07_07175 [Pseudomonadota bacterium]